MPRPQRWLCADGMNEAPARLSSHAAGPRLYVDAALAPGAALTLDGAHAHYLAGVLRLAEGNAVRLFNGRDGEWRAVIAEFGKKRLALTIEAMTRAQESVPDLWLCAAPLKRGRIDWVAEKACELGVAELRLVTTERTVVERVKLDRLRAHMIEAAEQCERTALPDLNAGVPLARMLEDWPPDRQLIFADEMGGEAIGGVELQPRGGILIGPEGGFTPAERSAIRDHPAAIAVSLGPRILRADTAAVAAISLWMARAGDWTEGGTIGFK